MTKTDYLQPTQFIDSQHPQIIQFAHETTAHCTTLTQKAIALYYAVRDGIRYNPYNISLVPEDISASLTLQRQEGYCIEKAMLMAAACRAVGIPARLGFANVKNHLATPKFVALLRTNVFVFHGYVALLLNQKWVKCTPSFNLDMCQKFKVQPLEFDGINDSIFQEHDTKGNTYMEYLTYHGEFEDLPFEKFVSELQTYYPHFFDPQNTEIPILQN